MVASGTSLVSGFLARYLIKNFGGTRSAMGGIVAMIVSQAMLGLSSSFVGFLVGAFFLGIALGSLGVIQNVLVIEAVPETQVQKWQSGLHSVYGIASLCSPLMVNLFHHLGYPWQYSFLAISIAGTFFLFFAMFMAGRQKPRSAHGPPDDRPEDKPHAPVAWPLAKAKAFELSPSLRWGFALMMGFYVAFELLVSTRMSLYSRTFFGLDLELANLFTSGFFISLTAGRILYFFWSPRLSIPSQLFLCLGAGIFFFLTGLKVHPLFLSLVGLCIAPIYPLTMTWAGKLFPKSVGTIASDCVAFSGITVVTMHWWVGFASDRFGLPWGMASAGAVGLIALIALWHLKQNVKSLPL